MEEFEASDIVVQTRENEIPRLKHSCTPSTYKGVGEQGDVVYRACQTQRLENASYCAVDPLQCNLWRFAIILLFLLIIVCPIYVILYIVLLIFPFCSGEKGWKQRALIAIVNVVLMDLRLEPGLAALLALVAAWSVLVHQVIFQFHLHFQFHFPFHFHLWSGQPVSTWSSFSWEIISCRRGSLLVSLITSCEKYLFL